MAIALQEDYAEALDDIGQEYTKRLAASAEQMEQSILESSDFASEVERGTLATLCAKRGTCYL